MITDPYDFGDDAVHELEKEYERGYSDGYERACADKMDQLAAVRDVIDTARKFCRDFTYDDKTKTAEQWADNPYLYNDLKELLAELDAYDALEK